MKVLFEEAQAQNQRTHSLGAFSEIQAIYYQNFNFEPLLLYFSCGLHHNIDLVTSGKDYAIGINQSITFSNSLQFNNVYFYEYLCYFYFRAGYVDKNDEHSMICFRGGIGPNLYKNYDKLDELKFTIVPNYFLETILDLGRPIFFRYHRTFFHRDRTKHGFQLGILFPL